jgi:positive regulator of sigma E activity
MRQDAYVLRGGQIARVLVQRVSACTGECRTCGACEEKRPLYADAYNPVSAGAGDSVVVETDTNVILYSAALVYLLPIALFIAAYFTAQGFGAKGWLCILSGAAGYALSLAAAKAYNRRRGDKPQCTIISVKDEN